MRARVRRRRVAQAAVGSLVVPLLVAAPLPVASSVAAVPSGPAPGSPVAAGSATSRSQGMWGPKAADGELTGLRTATSRTFADGPAFRTMLSSTPVNYRDANGAWQKIDDSLVATSGGWTNRADALSVQLPSDASGQLSVSTPAGAVGLRLRGALGAGSMSGSQVSYFGALPSTTVIDGVSSTGLKETLSLADGNAPTSFTYDVTLPSGTSLSVSHGALLVTSTAGKALATLPAPVARDSARGATESASPVSFTVAGTSGAPTVTLSVDAAWLSSPARVFPVLVDPSVTIGDGGDTYIEGGSDASTNYDTVNPMCAGYDTTALAYQRMLLDFDISDNFNTYMQVLNADLQLYVSSNTTGSFSLTSAGLSRPFNAGQATWNNAATGTAWTTAGGDLISSGPTTSDTITATSGWVHVYPTTLVSKWVNGDYNKYTSTAAFAGMMLKASTESVTAGKLCVASQQDTNGHAPQLTVYWQTVAGDRRSNTYKSYQVDDRETLKVNVATGNALVETTDDTVRGVGLDFNLARSYNSGAAPYYFDSYLGANWELSPSGNTEIEPWNDGSATFFTPTGDAYTFTKSGGSYVTPPGVDATLTYNSGPNTFTLAANDGSTTQTFSPHHLTSTTDRNSNTISVNDADADGDLDGWTDSESRSWSTTYWASGAGFGYLENVTDPASRSVTYNYTTAADGHTLLSSYVDPTGQTTSYAYYSTDLLHTITSPEGRTVTITYAFNSGTSGPVAQVCRTDSHTSTTPCDSFSTTWSSDPTGSTKDKATVTDANSHATTYEFDPDTMHVTKTTDADNHTRSASWTGDDLPASIGDDVSSVLSLSYTTNNALHTLTGSVGASSQFNYSGANGGTNYLPSSRYDGQSNCTSYSYDLSGNLMTAHPGQGEGTTDCNGTGGYTLTNGNQGDTGVANCGPSGAAAKTGELCTVTDGRGHTTSYSYDSHGNLATITPPAPLGASTVVIDASTNLLTSVTDGKSQKTSYFYDNLGRTTEIGFGGYTTSPCTSTAATAGSCIGYGYDHDGNLTSRLDNIGTTTFAYDGLNRVYSETFPDSTSTSVAYDGANNLTSYTDSAGTVTYHYDPANNLWDLTEPGGSCASYPTAPSFPNSTKCTGFTYNGETERTKISFPSGQTVLLCYDNSHRQTLVASYRPANSPGTCSSPGTSPFVKRAYSYAKSGSDTSLRTSITDQSGTTTYYGYDALNRLCWVGTATFSSCGSSSSQSYGYNYDNAGNITSVSHTGSSTVYDGYNNADEMCWSGTTNGSIPNPGSACTSNAGPSGDTDYLYDGNGNQCWSAASTGSSYTCGSAPSGATTLTYNSKNQMTAYGTTTFGYYDVGQSQRHDTNGTTYTNGLIGLTGRSDGYYWTRDPNGNLIDMRIGSGSTFTANYYALDAQGSTLAATDSTGNTDTAAYTYDPYGKTLTATGSQYDQNWQYASGYYQSSTGLTKMGDRYYNQNLGDWTQRDSIAGSIKSPAAVDRYSYAGDNPLNLTDSDGRDFFDDLGGWSSIGDAIGTAATAVSSALTNPCVVIGGAAVATVGATGIYLGAVAVGAWGESIGLGMAALGPLGPAALGAGLTTQGLVNSC